MRAVQALVGGLSALAVAYTGNALIWRIFQGRGTARFVPVWEELVKTGCGLLAGQLLATHAVFGLGEAVLELRRADWMAGFLALISHALFGLATAWCRGITGSWPLGWLLASGMHLFWNLSVLRLSRR